MKCTFTPLHQHTCDHKLLLCHGRLLKEGRQRGEGRELYLGFAIHPTAPLAVSKLDARSISN
eukprot:3459006-Pyramimonas_sp.AAC.1